MCEETKTGVIGSLELGVLAAPLWRVLRWPVAVFFGVPLFIGALWAFKWEVLAVVVPFTVALCTAVGILRRFIQPRGIRQWQAQQNRTALPVAKPARVTARAKVLRHPRAILAPAKAIGPARILPAQPGAVTPERTPRVL